MWPGHSLYRQFSGWWCDNCETARTWRPDHGCCSECGPVPLRPATVTIEFTDLEEGKRR